MSSTVDRSPASGVGAGLPQTNGSGHTTPAHPGAGRDDRAVRGVLRRLYAAAAAADGEAAAPLWVPDPDDVEGAGAAAPPIAQQSAGLPSSGFSAEFYPRRLRQPVPVAGRLRRAEVVVLEDSAWAFAVEAPREVPSGGAAGGPAFAVHHLVRLGAGWRLTARFALTPAPLAPPPSPSSPALNGHDPDGGASEQHGAEPGAAPDVAAVRGIVGRYLEAAVRGDAGTGVEFWAPVSWALNAALLAVPNQRTAGHGPAAGGVLARRAEGITAIQAQLRSAWPTASNPDYAAQSVLVWPLGAVAWAVSPVGSVAGAPRVIFQLVRLPGSDWKLTAQIELPSPPATVASVYATAPTAGIADAASDGVAGGATAQVAVGGAAAAVPPGRTLAEAPLQAAIGQNVAGGRSADVAGAGPGDSDGQPSSGPARGLANGAARQGSIGLEWGWGRIEAPSSGRPVTAGDGLAPWHALAAALHEELQSAVVDVSLDEARRAEGAGAALGRGSAAAAVGGRAGIQVRAAAQLVGRATHAVTTRLPLGLRVGAWLVGVAAGLIGLFAAQQELLRARILVPPAVWWYLAAAVLVVAAAGRAGPTRLVVASRPNGSAEGTGGARRPPGAAPVPDGPTSASSATGGVGRQAWQRLLGALAWPRAPLAIPALGLTWISWEIAKRTTAGTPYGLAAAAWLAGIGLFLYSFVPAGGTRAALRAVGRRCWVLLRRPRVLGASAVWTLAIGALCVVAAVLRLANVDRLPLTFSGDEGQMAVLSREVARGRLPNPFSTAWMGHPTLFYFLQAGMMRLIGFEAAAPRIVPALFGAATVPLVYALGAATYGRAVGLAAAALLTTSYWHLFFSRTGLNNAVDPAFYVATALLLWHGLFGDSARASVSGVRGIARRPRLWPFALCGVAAGLSQYFYTSSRLIPPVLVTFLVYACVRSGPPSTWGRWLRQHALAILVLVAGFLIALAPLLAHFLTVPGSFMHRVNQASILQPGWLEGQMKARKLPLAGLIGEQFWHTVQAFNRFQRTIAFYNVGRPLWMFPAHVFLVVGLVAVVLRPWRPAAALLTLLYIAPVVAGGVLSETTPNAARLILLAPVLPLLMAVGLERAATALRGVVRSFLPVGAAGPDGARSAEGGGRVASALPRLLGLLPGLLLGGYVLGATAWADLRYFFVDAPPHRENDQNSTIAADLARYVHAMGPEAQQYRVYLFGLPRMGYGGFASINYLTDSLPGQDVPEGVLDPAAYVDRTKGAIFAVPVYRAVQLERLRQVYPGGQSSSYNGPVGQPQPGPLLTIYRVSPEEIAGRTGPSTGP
jgi:4-amino-4-deoxy-L-arabinose transferase-like glycosyltransferase